MRADDPPPPLAPTDAAPLTALQPVQTLKRRWAAWLATLVMAAMLVVLGRELFDHGLAGLRRAVPTSPGFYVWFAASYFALPVCDFIIFRRLWDVPFAAFPALNRKRIANDLLVGYSGDAYFYAWARARLEMVAAPFGAVKDVSIISGISGNLTAFLLGAVALPLGYELIAPEVLRAMVWSLVFATAISLALLLFSRRVFSLRQRELWFVFWIDILRIAATCVTIALAWAWAMPSVSVGMWLFLVAGRHLVSRLPFLPNKDLIFANFAIVVIGHDRALTDLIAFTAASTLLMHGLLLLVFGFAYVMERMREWRFAS